MKQTILLALAALPGALACPARRVITETVDATPVSNNVLSSNVSPRSAAALSGEATFYGGNLSGGTCSFTTYSLPAGIYGTAFSGTNWDASQCGACLQVTGPNGKSIKVMVVDECRECGPSHLDLFQSAFTQLGVLSAGILSTSYTPVPCGITAPFQLHNKSGTGAHWFSMQVVGANEPVATLEVSTDGGKTWQATQRQPYNFFENSKGFGTQTVDVRVTSSGGKKVVVNRVGVGSGSLVTAGANF